jgi:hypothetical protein
MNKMTSTPMPPRNAAVSFYEEHAAPCIGLARERCKMHGNMEGYEFYQRLHEEILLVLQRDGEYPALAAHQFEKARTGKV